MKVVRTIAELETARRRRGLVPTMGALHDGHVALLRAARQENARVVMSLFVNPAQFDEQADLAAYPRDEARDLELAEEEGVDVVFAPAADEIYPPGFATWVDPGRDGSRGRGPARALPRRRHGLPEAVQPRPPASARTSARRTRSRSP